jgi:hypothetical protein
MQGDEDNAQPLACSVLVVFMRRLIGSAGKDFVTMEM